MLLVSLLLFFFKDTATTEIYTLSLHDALPISNLNEQQPAPEMVDHLLIARGGPPFGREIMFTACVHHPVDRKSTRLNSSHLGISYAVFCLKKKKITLHR